MIINQISSGSGLNIIGSVKSTATASSAIQKGEFIQKIDLVQHTDATPFPGEAGTYYMSYSPCMTYLKNGYYFMIGRGYNAVTPITTNCLNYYVFREVNGELIKINRHFTSNQYNVYNVTCVYADDNYALCIGEAANNASYTSFVLYKIVYDSNPTVVTGVYNTSAVGAHVSIIKLDDSHFAAYAPFQYNGEDYTKIPIFFVFSFSDTALTLLGNYPLNSSSISPTAGYAAIMSDGKIVATYSLGATAKYAVVKVNNDYSLTYEKTNEAITFSGISPSLSQSGFTRIEGTDILVWGYAYQTTSFIKLEYSASSSSLTYVNYITLESSTSMLCAASNYFNTFVTGTTTKCYLLDSDLNIILNYNHNLPYTPSSIAYSNDTYYFAALTTNAQGYLGYYYSKLIYSSGVSPAINKIDGIATSDTSAGETVTFLTDSNYTPGSVYSPASATANEILEGYTAWSNGELLTGTASKGASFTNRIVGTCTSNYSNIMTFAGLTEVPPIFFVTLESIYPDDSTDGRWFVQSGATSYTYWLTILYINGKTFSTYMGYNSAIKTCFLMGGYEISSGTTVVYTPSCIRTTIDSNGLTISNGVETSTTANYIYVPNVAYSQYNASYLKTNYMTFAQFPKPNTYYTYCLYY